MTRHLTRKGKYIIAGGAAALIIIIAIIIAVATPSDNPQGSENARHSDNPGTDISIMAVGDNLIHGPIYRQAKARAAEGGYDFSFAYQEIEPYLTGYDIKLINQETPLGGEALGLSSYPRFNSPTQLGDHLVNIGFNAISHANNHVLDADEQGLMNTISYWQKKQGATMAGIYANQESADNLHIFNKDGVKIALLAYTYGTNGLQLPSSSSAVINYIDREKIKTDLAKAKILADVSVVMIHWGVEYEPKANEEQRDLAQMMANYDADIIIGSHPHVIQDVAALPQADGGKCLCYYSLGNFISAQDKPATMLGGMASVRLNYKPDTDEISFTKVEFIPLVTQFNSNYSNLHVVPLAKYTDQMAQNHGVRNISRSYFHNLVKNTVDSKYINIR